MPITLYELAGADPQRRFSPYCWRIRFALAHKGLDFEGVPWRFTETERLAFSGQGKVPVIVDGETVVVDSWAIAAYLEDAYPNRPSLFGGKWAGPMPASSMPGPTGCCMPASPGWWCATYWTCCTPTISDYFRTSRERAFGRSLEEVVADRDEGVLALRKLLQPVRDVLGHQPWLGGDAPDYADYIVLGSLQWPRCVSPFVLLEESDPVRDWQLRGLALFDGLGANAPALAA